MHRTGIEMQQSFGVVSHMSLRVPRLRVSACPKQAIWWRADHLKRANLYRVWRSQERRMLGEA
jgi:hypothetical protein